MLNTSIIKNIYLILNLCSYLRVDGSVARLGKENNYEKAHDVYPNGTSAAAFKIEEIHFRKTWNEFDTINVNKAIAEDNDVSYNTMYIPASTDNMTLVWSRVADGNERHKTILRFRSERLINNFKSIGKKTISTIVTANSLGKNNLARNEIEVDRTRNEISHLNATGLSIQSYTVSDELQAIQNDQQQSRKQITAHWSGIKGFSVNANSPTNNETVPKTNRSVISRGKRNAKHKGTLTQVDEVIVTNLADVYIYLHTILKNTVNFTMRANGNDQSSDAERLCRATMNVYYADCSDDGNVYCNSSWDDYSCWPRTLSGTSVSIPCPGYLDGINEEHNATKYCHENGTWAEKAVYNMCINEDETLPTDDEIAHHMAIRVIYNVGFCISTLALIIALFIFLYFRSLRCLRNSIHCHLIVTFIIKNIVWIIMRHSLMYIQDSKYSWCCKTLTSIFNFVQATNFFWMFVEGLYLHIIIVWTYSADKIKLRYLLLVGWGLPTVNIITWIIVRAIHENDHCWLPQTDGNSMYDYIYIGPILFVLFANLIFLSTIVWVLITKLRASHSLEARQYRKAVKATIILFPLLGIIYVLFIIPPSDHPQVKIIFKYINAVLQSFQGLLVAVFYCFLNGEVKGVLKKKISRFNDARSLSTKYTRTSYGWTRGSRDYGNTITLGNGSLIDPNHRMPNIVKDNTTEDIPLTDSRIV